MNKEEITTNNEVTCIEFYCDDNLSKYTDSMLFDSGTNIAYGTYIYNDEEVDISLDICGSVEVTYKNEVYTTPSEFPIQLRNLIKAHPNDWDCEDDVYVGFNNWFEVKSPLDGWVCEDDISTMSEDGIYDLLMYYARYHFELE